ncbi:MAG: pelota family protein [Nitrososphaerota archaeon]|nr:pelota family protein [Nitrososphaerota archaeon]MDG6955739.1 pelota family protein [Nitrososphaerota archaeon]MDG6958768.1 pelota family protein [Nitrososphaerota archaeon]MDG6960028.1 pelota family protein [Nitrososphaerota archaeon]MDG6965435.1 pelota family protein [Nitrososphaerota archaeon]
MKVSDFNPKHGYCSLTIESAEDLWTMRRLIAKGDVVVTRGSRVVKREEEYSRPDKGERVKVTLALAVDEVHLDSSIERIRVKGTIIEASDESVTKVGSHSVTLSPGHSMTLRKNHWSQLDIQLVRSSGPSYSRFVLVAVDRREAGIGLLSGSHLSVVTTIESGLGGKMGEERSPRPYLSKVAEAVSQLSQHGDRVIVAGPGNFKNSVANQINEALKSEDVRVVDGPDLTGGDGIRAMIKSPPFQALAKGSVAVEMQQLVSEIVKRISMGDPKVAYALPRVAKAAAAGAVEACAVSDDVFSLGVDESQLVGALNEIEAKGGKVFLADSSMEFGKQVSSFGGIAALLRYALRA